MIQIDSNEYFINFKRFKEKDIVFKITIVFFLLNNYFSNPLKYDISL
jgi:hypothetical protein